MSTPTEEDNNKLVGLFPSEVKEILSVHLNINSSLGRDWRGVAGYLKLDVATINHLSTKNDPTGELIQKYEKDSGTALTVGLLFAALQSIKRLDVISALIPYISTVPSSVSGVLNGHFSEDRVLNGHSSEHRVLNTQTTLEDSYDVMISYAKEDANFAKILFNILKANPYNFKVCLDFKDFIPGFNHIDSVYDAIANRCRKVIVVLSSSYVNSGECDFQAKAALAISQGANRHKVIPILYERCEVPGALRILTHLDYADEDQREYFWPRLVGSIKQIK